MPAIPFYLLIPAPWPYEISSRFNDPRSYPFAPNRLQLHEGVDFMPAEGAPSVPLVRAAQRGIVDRIGFDARGYGNFVRIVHDWNGERYVTWYGHLKEVRTKENKYVLIGETIGVAGDTGNATAVHVHLTLQHSGHGLKNYVVPDVIDPEPFVHANVLPFDEAWWTSDVTIPDNTVVTAGQRFRKTWSIRNAGTTLWNNGYRLAFFSDEPMNGPASVPLPAAKPGEIVQVSVDLTAPETAGSLRSTWKPHNAMNQFFDSPLHTDIQVKAQATGHSEAHYVEDVTVPYDTPMKPGQAFRKTWKLLNSGETEWGAGYALAFVLDQQMGAPDSVPLPAAKPGDEVDVSVDFVAPMVAGKARSTWRPRDPNGDFFDFPVRVEINVLPSGQINDAQAASDVIVLPPGATFVKTWRITNTGQTRWGGGYTLAFIGGDQMSAPHTVPVPATKPQDQATISVTLKAPSKVGGYTGRWRLCGPDGLSFGPVFTAEIEVSM